MKFVKYIIIVTLAMALGYMCCNWCQHKNCLSQIKPMAVNTNLTLSIIKPDATAKNVIGDIESIFEHNNLKIVAAKMMLLTRSQAEEFYAVHKSKPFFNELVDFMTSGPVLVQVLEAKNAVAKNREVMVSIRQKFGTSVGCNAVHGSDTPENAAKEIGLFFKSDEIFSKN